MHIGMFAGETIMKQDSKWRRFAARGTAALALVAAAGFGAHVLTDQGRDRQTAAFSLQDALPQECLLHVSVAGLASAEKCKNTALGKICDEPQMQEFLKPIRALLNDMATGMSQELTDQFGLTMEDAKALLQGGLTLTLVDGEIGQHGPTDLDVLLTADLGSNAAAITKLDGVIQQTVKGGMGAEPKAIDLAGTPAWTIEVDGMPVTWSIHGSTLVAGTVNETVTGVLTRLKAQSPGGGLRSNPEFATFAKKTMPKGDAMAIVYVDVKGLIARFNASPFADESISRVLTNVGLDSIASGGYALTQEGSGFCDRMYVSMPKGAKGLYANVKHNTAGLRTLAMAPEKSLAFGASYMEIGKTLISYADMLASIDPDQGAGLQDAEAQLDEKLGFSFRKDVAPALGNELAFWVAGSPFGGLIPEIMVAVHVRDAAKINECLDKATARFGEEAPTRRFTFLGRTVGYLDTGRLVNGGGSSAVGFGMKPCWTIDGDFLLAALTPQTMKNYLVARQQQRPAISANRDFNNTLAQLRQVNPEAGQDGVAYVDVGSLMTMAIDTLAHVGQSIDIPAVLPVGGGMPNPIDMTAFPTTDVFQRHLFGMITSTTVSDVGMLTEMYSPMGYVPTVAALAVPLGVLGAMQARSSAVATEPMPIPEAEEEDGMVEPEEPKKDGGNR
jgi:hypothetical protein